MSRKKISQVAPKKAGDVKQKTFNLSGINSAQKNAFLTYYGGKQTLANRIISLIPPHTTCIEPFIGGGAILAMKPPDKVSIINDKDGRIDHFYRTIKEQPEDFLDEIDKLIYDEHTYRKYQAIYQGKEEASNLDRAVAVWYMQFSFAGELGAGFGFSRVKNRLAPLMVKSSHVVRKRPSYYGSWLMKPQGASSRIKTVIKEWWRSVLPESLTSTRRWLSGA